MLKSRIVNRIFLGLMFCIMLADVFGGISLLWYAGVLLVYSLIHVYGSTVLAARFFLPAKFKGDPSSHAVALTFDDGPVPGKTERILEILKAHNTPAAFFCIGHRVNEHPTLAKRIREEGHLIGNHSYWHGKTFDLQLPAKISEELQNTDSAIQKSAGVTPRFFRPPYGVTNPMVAAAVDAGKYTTIGWSVRSFDTMIRDSSRLMHRVTSQLKSGDIVLFHDYCDSTIDMLPGLLKHIAEVGLKIVRVDELLNEKAYA